VVIFWQEAGLETKNGTRAEAPGRRERKKQEVAQRILGAALELFREQGYEATTVEQIAERADVAKGTFFNHFERKDALLAQLADEVFGSVLEELGPPASWEGTARDQVQRLFLALAEGVRLDAALSKTMFIENMRNFWMRTEVDPLEVEFRQVVMRMVQGGVERGELDADTDVDRAGKLLEAVHVTTLIEWLKDGVPLGVYEEELGVKLDIIFRGLVSAGSATKGRSR
jgi:TetR/AcrR family transcriptional regulator, cholesterol catabolism regulator